MMSVERERPSHREAAAHAASQPFVYPLQRELVEPDWRRLPGYRDITAEQWESAQWQRAHTVKNLRELKEVLGEEGTEGLLQLLQVLHRVGALPLGRLPLLPRDVPVAAKPGPVRLDELPPERVLEGLPRGVGGGLPVVRTLWDGLHACSEW